GSKRKSRPPAVANEEGNSSVDDLEASSDDGGRDEGRASAKLREPYGRDGGLDASFAIFLMTRDLLTYRPCLSSGTVILSCTVSRLRSIWHLPKPHRHPPPQPRVV